MTKKLCITLLLGIALVTDYTSLDTFKQLESNEPPDVVSLFTAKIPLAEEKDLLFNLLSLEKSSVSKIRDIPLFQQMTETFLTNFTS